MLDPTLDKAGKNETVMQNEEPTDATFAQEALARLEPVEPSASLSRRVAQIPIPQQPSAGWLPWNAWPARLLLGGALTLGALVGSVPWDGEGSGEAAETALPLEASSESDELEGALSLALGSGWTELDAFSEGSP